MNRKELEKNADKIGELQKDEGGPFRMVNGQKIYQIEENTEADRKQNRLINLWRMRGI